MEFDDFAISAALRERLKEHGITKPTEIQERSIPAIGAGHDVLAESETGSGKTLAFAIPLLERLQPGKLQVLILCPTRELAKQVAGEFDKFNVSKLKTLTVYGGVGLEPQIEALPTTDIVIGTPGRVMDLMERGALIVDDIAVLVLDEADKMLDMGFIEDIEEIMAALPEERQSLLYSATIGYRIQELTKDYMRDPVLIRAKSDEVRGHLFQGYYVVHPWQKISLLLNLIKREPAHSLVFVRTKVAADHVAAELSKRGIKALAMHGDITQAKREQTVKEFQDEKFHVLVATDVAARGLHIDGITHVYNYDLPDEPETYVHRVGRTARQGADGDAITLLSEDDYRKFDGIMDLYDDEIEKLDYNKWGQLERIPPSPRRDDGDRRGGPRRGGPRGDRSSGGDRRRGPRKGPRR